MPGPVLEAGAVAFCLPDPDARLAGVRLEYHLRPPYPDRAFSRADGHWRLSLPKPPVDRLEYRLELEGPDGSRASILDPTNPVVAPGVFGDQSVVEFPGYRAPAWLADAPASGRVREVSLPGLDGVTLPAVVWSDDAVDEGMPAPTLLVHDGPELARFSSLTRWAAWAAAEGRIPPCRVVLLHPRERNAWYSASPSYLRALADVALPALLAVAPAAGPLVAHGASLGALAWLHVAWSRPGLLGGLFLQSGSFFRLRHDAHEAARFSRFWRVHDHVAAVLSAPLGTAWPIVRMTVGTGEENLENNRDLARALAAQGADVSLEEVPDGHTWIGWRDAFDPTLLELLGRCWPASSGR
jgi:enterochelin esterase family protein